MNNLITNIPYEEVAFYWVSSHWDYHLEGICFYNGELCRFKTDIKYADVMPTDDEEGDGIIATCDIYKLSMIEKFSWISRKIKFEFFVGKHWTYPHRNGNVGFKMNKILFTIYYLKSTIKRLLSKNTKD